MEFLLAMVIGVLFGVGVFMMLRRSLVKLIIGLSLLAHGSNLLIFTVGRVVRNNPPIIPEGAETLTDYADPVPQALILTAIVIGFGVQAFAIVLMHRYYKIVKEPDLDKIKSYD